MLDTAQSDDLRSRVTLDLRILGPLEVSDETGPITLGGQRQRALLAVLALSPGRVVATDRLVDLLWGEGAPKTAMASLQNGVAQLRKALGAETLETRAPGYVLCITPDQVDAHRFERSLSDARGLPADQRREHLSRSLAMWRGPVLADFAFENFAQSEIRRLDELRFAALAERIDADLELGRHGDVIGELEGLVAEHPLRESFLQQLMVALYRAGRQAEALDLYQAARTRFVDELGIEPGSELRQLQAEILRQEAGLALPGSVASSSDEDGEIVKALLAGRIVPVLGLDGGGDLAAHLASAFGVPDDQPVDLARVSQYVATMQGSGPLYDELHARYEAAVEPGPLHRFLARLPALLRERGAPHQLIVTTNYDLALEQAFLEAGRSSTSSPTSRRVPTAAASGIGRPAAPRPIEVPNTYATELSLERRTVILKLHGGFDASRSASGRASS